MGKVEKKGRNVNNEWEKEKKLNVLKVSWGNDYFKREGIRD